MKSNRIIGVNNILFRTVPLFLALLLLLQGAIGCNKGAAVGKGSGFSAEEGFFIESYLRLIEARTMALDQDSLAEGRFNFLREDLPADSLRAIAGRISRETPQRWQPIYAEIVRRKEIQENDP